MDSAIQQAFFSTRNRNMLVSLIERDMTNMKKKPLTDAQKGRIVSITDHYMKEVYRVQGDKPLAFLNKETITISEKQYQRSKHVPATAPVQEKKVTFASVVATGRSSSAAGEQDMYNDTGTVFEKVQQSRIAEAKSDMPSIPDFRTSMVDNDTLPSMAELFERAKAKREMGGSSGGGMQSTDLRDLDGDMPAGMDLVNSLIVQPTRQPLASPNLAQPIVQVPRNTLQQQVLIREEAVQNFREIESNLIIYSGDRDLTSSGENRYNFTVSFDPGSMSGRNLSSVRRFNNIVRIELVKAIIPAESINTLVYKESSGEGGAAASNFESTVLSYPYVVLHVDEFAANNYGTDEKLDTAFGVLQYDSDWCSDSDGAAKGYYAMIPKFLKCQRIFHPTPLSTLQRLTIRLQKPDGDLIGSGADMYGLTDVLTNTDAAMAGTIYAGAATEYLVLKVGQYFSHFAVKRGETVRLRDVVADVAGYVGTPEQVAVIEAAAADFLGFLGRTEGHLVCDVAHDAGGGAIAVGWNSVGYCNYIIIRTKFDDPATGSVSPWAFGGSLVAAETMYGALNVESGHVMNMSRQTQVVFRIITREVDSMGQIRPDNIRPSGI